MLRLLNAPVALLVMSAMLYSSVTPAAACSCSLLNEPDEVRQLLVDWNPLVVEGVIAPIDETSQIKFLPEIVYWGESPDVITLDQPWVTPYDNDPYDHLGPMCDYTLTGRSGTRYLLFLSPSQSDPSVYRPSGCASYAMAYVEQPPGGATRNIYRERYDALQIATGRAHAEPVEFPAGGGQPDPDAPLPHPGNVSRQEVPDDASKDTPWAIVLPLAFAIPLAVLFVPAFLRKRSPGH
jgi:hypothetical protein